MSAAHQHIGEPWDDDEIDEPLDGEWPDESDWTASESELEEMRLANARARHRWQYLPAEPPPEPCRAELGALGTLVRALRWRTRTSQREFALLADVPGTTISRMERDAEMDPRLSTLQRMVEACGLRLAVVDDEGTQLAIPFGQEGFRDVAGRRLPAHLATYDPRGRYWWGHGLIGGPDPRHPEPARVHARRPRRPLPQNKQGTARSADESADTS